MLGGSNSFRTMPQGANDWLARNLGRDDPGEIITFYSYKGGTGRSLALVNCVGLIAQQWPATAKPMLVVDFDLEAAGIHHYLKSYLPPSAELADQAGTLELFEGIQALVDERLRAPDKPDGPDGNGPACLDDVACSDLVNTLDLSPYLTHSRLASSFVMTAGRFDASYSQRLSRMNWEQLFSRAPGIFRALAARFQRDFSFTFIDARTGLSDTSGICTMLLPDVLVLVFTPNRQSLSGIEHLVREASSYRKASSDLRALRIYPLASRVELSSEDSRLVWQRGAAQHPVFGEVEGYQNLFARLFEQERGVAEDLSAYFNQVQIPHSPDYAYGERLCFTPEASRDRLSLRHAYESFLPWLTTGAQPWEDPAQILARLRAQQWLRAALPPVADDEVAWRGWFDALGKRVAQAREQLALPADFAALARAVPMPEAFDLGFALALSQAMLVQSGFAAELFELLLAQADQAEPQWDVATVLERWLTLKLDPLSTAEKMNSIGNELLQNMDQLVTALEPPRAVLWAWQARLADVYRSTGSAATARPLLENLLTQQRELLGVEHPATLRSMNNLASTLQDQGDLTGARSMQAWVLDICRTTLGPEHPDTLTSLHNLASTLQAQGDLAGAKTLDEQALDIRRRVLGPEHPDTLASMGNLSITLHAQGDLPEAKAMQEQVLDIRRRILGPEHPATLTSMGNLAVTLRAQGDLAGARTLHEHELEICRRILGPEHPDTLSSLNNLANTLEDQGDLAGAKTMHEQVLDFRRRILGPEHPATLTSMNNLASTLHAQGDLTGAQTMQEQVLDIRRRILGPEHPDTLTSTNNLAITLQAQGDLTGARTMQEQVLELRRRILGPEHPDTLTSMNNLANTLQAQGDLAGARTMQEQVLELRRRILGPEHPNTLSSMGNLASALWTQGDLVGARNLEEQVLDIHRRILGPEHPATLTSMNNLALTLRDQGEMEGAGALLHSLVQLGIKAKDAGQAMPLSALDALRTLLDMASEKQGSDSFDSLFQQYPALVKELLGRGSSPRASGSSSGQFAGGV